MSTEYIRAVSIRRGRVYLTSKSSNDDVPYQKEIGRVITTLLPAWLQYRNTFVPLKNKKEENRS